MPDWMTRKMRLPREKKRLLFSRLRETRQTAGVRASRWCAGCHDPVPFFGGVFQDPREDPKYDP